MKRLMILAGTLCVFSASAVAGGSNNGSHAAVETDKLPIMAMKGETEAEFLARLQKLRESTAAAKELLELPVTYN